MVKIRKKTTNELLSEGYNLAESGKIKEGLELFYKVIEEDPNFSMAWNNIGWYTAQLNGDFNFCLEKCKKAIELDPNNYDAMHSVGWAYKGLKDYKNAIKYLDK